MGDVQPDAEREWLDPVKDDWVAFWDSPLANRMDKIHIPAIRRLFTYRSMWLEIKFELVAAGTSLVDGSRGNKVLNPLIRAMRDLETQIQVIEAHYGLTLKSAAQLGIDLGQVELTWQQVAKGHTIDAPQIALPVTVVSDG